MSAAKTLVIRNGTLIDGSGQPAGRNDAIVICGDRIRSVGALPPDVELEDRRNVEVIDAAGQWIMPGLIDAHCHVSYGYPAIKGEGKGKGRNSPRSSRRAACRRCCAPASPASRCRAAPGSPMSACATPSSSG